MFRGRPTHLGLSWSVFSTDEVTRISQLNVRLHMSFPSAFLCLSERRAQRVSSRESRCVRGQLSLSLHYQRGTLMVMVHHARSLSTVAGGQEPSPYVKVYLLPDPSKLTKRKTKVVRRNCHPTFMEMVSLHNGIWTDWHKGGLFCYHLTQWW